MSESQTSARVLRGRNRIGSEDQAGDGQSARARIQEVALAMFIEEGYDKTSLREIAERLGVTKAALYYHFPTKEDIVTSLIEDRIGQLRELIEWGKSQPRNEATRLELVHRYAEDLQGPQHSQIMTFFERNQTALKSLTAGEAMRQQMMEVLDLLCEPTDPPALQLRRAVAIFALHASTFIFRTRGVPDDERRAAALEVARELVLDQKPAGGTSEVEAEAE